MVAGLGARVVAPGRPRPGPVAYAAVPVLYWLSAVVCSHLTTTPDGVSLLWMPNAFLLAAFVRFRGRGWPIFVLTTMVAEIVADHPAFGVLDALAFWLGNVVETTVAWLLLERWGFDPRFERVADVGRFVLAAPLAGAMIGSAVGTVVLQPVRPTGQTFLETMQLWWTGDALGLLIATPLCLSLLYERGAPRHAGYASRPLVDVGYASRPYVDLVMALGGIGVLALLPAQPGAFGADVRPLMVLPFVVYAAVRIPLRWLCALVATIALYVVWLTASGRSPYGYAPPQSAALETQEFVLVISVLSLGLSALLTNVRISEGETERANAALRRKTYALEQSNAELRRIAFVAAHDLQTPLRAICRFSQLLGSELGGTLGPVADDWVRRVAENTLRLEALLRDLGVLAAVDSSDLAFVPVDMGAVADEVARAVQGALAEAGGTVTWGSLPTVQGDRIQLHQLLKELVCNAIKFRGPEPPEIRVAARAGSADWVFSVQDNGVGVPPDERERIFELFYRPAGARAAPGTGFGLALCARIVHRHGGCIWVEPAAGSGSIFSFSLPREPTT